MVLEAFGPALVLLSAGFDAHEWDPLGGMRLSTGRYTRMTRYVRAVTDRRCRGRVVAVTEGGYDLEVLEACLTETLSVMRDPVFVPSDRVDGSTERADAALEQVRHVQASFWPTI